jgi:hypothetical protein
VRRRVTTTLRAIGDPGASQRQGRGCATADQVRSIVWVDAGGFTTITKVRTATGAAAIQTALLAAANADYLQQWEGPLVFNGAPAPTAAAYQPANYRAVLTFQCADFSQVDIIIPAPKVSDFLADKATINPAAVGIAALIAACIGALESSTGSLATTFIAGTLQPSPL